MTNNKTNWALLKLSDWAWGRHMTFGWSSETVDKAKQELEKSEPDRTNTLIVFRREAAEKFCLIKWGETKGLLMFRNKLRV